MPSTVRGDRLAAARRNVGVPDRNARPAQPASFDGRGRRGTYPVSGSCARRLIRDEVENARHAPGERRHDLGGVAEQPPPTQKRAPPPPPARHLARAASSERLGRLVEVARLRARRSIRCGSTSIAEDRGARPWLAGERLPRPAHAAEPGGENRLCPTRSGRARSASRPAGRNRSGKVGPGGVPCVADVDPRAGGHLHPNIVKPLRLEAAGTRPRSPTSARGASFAIRQRRGAPLVRS